MSDSAGPAPTTAVGRVLPHSPQGFTVRRDDFGAFRALEPGTNELVVLRPETEGLLLERVAGRELIPWSAIEGITLTSTEAGRARIPTARVLLASGPPLDYADALSPGGDGLPLTLGPGQSALLRVERCRMLTAAIVAGAGLAPATLTSFGRGPRGVPEPALAARPRVLPQWAPPACLVMSVLALVAVFDIGFLLATAVIGVVLVHELGHVLAMRARGMRVRGVLFVPLFGAATFPEHSFRTRWDEALVALAGPATGLPFAGAIALALGSDALPAAVADTLRLALVWALGINLLNLLPLMPLDGGRVMACLAAGLPRALRAVAAFAPVAIFALTLLALGGHRLEIAVAAFLGLCVYVTRASLRRQAAQSWMHRLPRPLAALRSALCDVTHGFTGRAREDVDGGVAAAPLAPEQVAIVFVLYCVEVAALLAAVGAFHRANPGVLSGLGGGD
jgi:Zn-dependent protease